jgi:diacylglycerol kinase (ATP)
MTAPRALLLVNPNARRGEEALSVIPQLEAGGLSVQVERFGSGDEVADDIVRRGPQIDLAIVCGGDGTVSCAARGIIAAGLPMGILPLGTANDLARTLGIPTELKSAAEVILKGRRRRIDVGAVNDVPFFNVASLGLSADVARRLTPAVKKRWGALGYSVQAVKVLGFSRPFHAVISCGQTDIEVDTLQIAVGNGRYYGGGAVIEKDAKVDDGRLDLYSLAPMSLWKVALMSRAFREGRHGVWSEVDTAKSRQFWIRTDRPMPINADGEIVTETPAYFEVKAGAVEVYVP